jgi:hypothetical protein
MHNATITTMGRMISLITALVCWSPLGLANTYDVSTIENQINVGTYGSSVVVDAQGTTLVCFADQTAGMLKLAERVGNAWRTVTIDDDNGSGDRVGSHCEMRLDSVGKVHIVYFNTTDKEIRHAQRTNNQWTIRTVDAPIRAPIFGSMRPLSLAVGSAGQVAIAYYDSQDKDLKYASLAGGQWTTQTVASQGDVGRYPSLAFDSNDHAAIAYTVFTNNDSAALYYIAHDGNAWIAPELIDDTGAAGAYASLVFDTNNAPHIAYRRKAQRTHAPYYLHHLGDAWSAPVRIGEFSQFDSGGGLRMIPGPEGTIHILYREYFVSALFPNVHYLKMTSIYFATNTATQQIRTDRVTFSAAPTKDYTGIGLTLDAQDRPIATYVQRTNQSSMLKQAQLTAWTPQIRVTFPDNDHVEAGEQITIRWLDFDPDSNARIRFFTMDSDFLTERLGNLEVREDDAANEALLDISGLAEGTYQIMARISEAEDFQFYSSSAAVGRLVVPARVAPAAPEPAQQQQLDPNPDPQPDADQDQADNQQNQQQADPAQDQQDQQQAEQPKPDDKESEAAPSAGSGDAKKPVAKDQKTKAKSGITVAGDPSGNQSDSSKTSANKPAPGGCSLLR